MVLIHFATNLLLLIPLLVTSKINKTGFLIWDLNFAAVAYNVQARHEFLMAHIEVFKEEQNAFDLLSSLSWQSLRNLDNSRAMVSPDSWSLL